MPIDSIKTTAVIVPPFDDFYATPHRFSSLGAQIVVQLLKKHNLDVHFFNFPLVSSSSLAIPAQLHHLKHHLIPGETGRCSYFTKYKHYGPSFEECANKILLVKPNIVFVSCFAFCYADSAIHLCKEISTLLPETTIVIGGAGASALPGYFVEHDFIDYVLDGEAEITLPLFLKFINGELGINEVHGCVSRKNGVTTHTNSKRFTRHNEIEPAYSLFESDHELRINLTLSRGCPLGCSFCSNYLCHGTEYRHISDSSIQDILDGIKRQTGDTTKKIIINYEDDNILLDPDFFYRIILAFKNVFPGARFFTENGIDYRLLAPSHAQALIDLGLAQFNFSLASVHSAVLDSMSRNADLAQYDSLLSLAKKTGIPVITYFICGHENDTRATIAENLSFLYKRDTSIGISLFYPVPGIAGFTDNTMFNPGNAQLCCGSSAYPWNKSVSTATMITAFRLARIMNCSKSEPQNDLEMEVIRRTFLLKRVHTIIKNKGTKMVIEVPIQDVELVEAVLN